MSKKKPEDIYTKTSYFCKVKVTVLKLVKQQTSKDSVLQDKNSMITD